LNTVAVKSIDRQAIIDAVQHYARQLRTGFPEIHRIIWFGSWVHGYPRPGSDVDLCLVIDETDLPPRERSVQYLPVGFPVGIDLFVYTREEFEQLATFAPGWQREIIKGIDI
jgi:predicted nucleotidyltransferase